MISPDRSLVEIYTYTYIIIIIVKKKIIHRIFFSVGIFLMLVNLIDFPIY
jgi:hypothetical protein